ncbi:hypothetical protein M513_12043, partial [Trichuris suis]
MRLGLVFLLIVLFYEVVSAEQHIGDRFIAGCSFQAMCEIQDSSSVNISSSIVLHLHPYVVVNPSTNPPTYRLKVNSTWRPYFIDRPEDLLGFQLNVTDKQTNESSCFTIRVENVSSFANGNRVSMLFWFWTADLFKYEHTYHVQLSSLPASTLGSIFVEQRMPDHPDALPVSSDNGLPCSVSGHRDAHRWVTAFRLVHKKPWQRAIDVEFIAAPPAYCFEAYELRLIHESKNIVQSAVVSADSLTWETMDNRFIAYGKYSFENVEPGNYRIG